MGHLRSAFVFMVVSMLKYVSRLFYRFDFAFLGPTPPDPWGDIRLVIFLNHTSLFEPIFIGVVPHRFLWRLAAHGVVPAADKTTDRPLVGFVYKLVAHHVIAITRQRDDTWFQVLQKIDPKSMVVIAPEGRMKRANGLDLNGKAMNVRGGVADVLQAIKSGRMLIAYSGGLHHVQVPGHMPRPFKTVALRVENLEISDYMAGILARGGEAEFKKTVMKDLDERRDRLAPEEGKQSKVA